MNLNLAAMYGTPGASSEEQTKLAEAELFSKLAAENGIDLNQLSNEQIQELWSVTFSKTAEEDEKKDDEKDEDEKEEEKKEAAAREHGVKLAQAEEESRAHYLGQVMAHSYVAELSKIAAAREAGETVESPELDKEAAMPAALKNALGKVKSVAGAGADKAKAFGSKAKEFGAKGVAKTKEVGGKAVSHVKEHKGAYGAGAAGVGGAGAGFAAGRFGKKKESSVLDGLALEAAVKIAHADGRFDLDEVAEKVSAVAILGLEESTKLAATAEQQVEIRALEYLEAAGYPVEWS
jgi:hypothetical protein